MSDIDGDEEYRRGLWDAWKAIQKLIKTGHLTEPANSERNGIVMAANQVMNLIDPIENWVRSERS